MAENKRKEDKRMKLRRKKGKLLQVWVEPSIHSSFQRLASQQGRSISGLVREGMAKVLADYSRRNR